MNLFEQLGLRNVINASGRMSILGVSTISDSVAEAMKMGGQHYVEMKELVEKAGKAAADLIGSESALIVNSASSGIALSVAAVIAKDSCYGADKLYEAAEELPNEILIQKGHNVDYGAPVETMVQVGGGKLKEAGYANGCSAKQLESAITSQTAAILYVKSHHCVQKNMVSLEEVKEICKRHGLPLLVDAAAEEDLRKYPQIADVVIYSGSKALEGPTSGIVAGKKQYIDDIRPHLSGIGRCMKVGKESIFGVLQALQNYWPKKDTSQEQQELIAELFVLNHLPGVHVTTKQDDAGRPIFRGRISIDESKAGKSCLQVVEELKEGDPAIFTRDYYANVGHFDIDPRPLKEGDMEIIVNKLQHILGGH